MTMVLGEDPAACQEDMDCMKADLLQMQGPACARYSAVDAV